MALDVISKIHNLRNNRTNDYVQMLKQEAWLHLVDVLRACGLSDTRRYEAICRRERIEDLDTLVLIPASQLKSIGFEVRAARLAWGWVGLVVGVGVLFFSCFFYYFIFGYYSVFYFIFCNQPPPPPPPQRWANFPRTLCRLYVLRADLCSCSPPRQSGPAFRVQHEVKKRKELVEQQESRAREQAAARAALARAKMEPDMVRKVELPAEGPDATTDDPLPCAHGAVGLVSFACLYNKNLVGRLCRDGQDASELARRPSLSRSNRVRNKVELRDQQEIELVMGAAVVAGFFFSIFIRLPNGTDTLIVSPAAGPGLYAPGRNVVAARAPAQVGEGTAQAPRRAFLAPAAPCRLRWC